MNCLLDKGTVRQILNGFLSLAQAKELTENGKISFAFFSDPEIESQFIVPATSNILKQISEPERAALVVDFLSRVEVLYPARYFTRWTRRLRDYGFTREDAHVLALGTFGANEENRLVHIDYVVTWDQRMINNWTMNSEKIQLQLDAMQVDISSPYNQASLPRVVHPVELR